MKSPWGRVFSIFLYILDAIVPPRERTARTNARGAEDIPLFPRSHQILGKHITTVMNYEDRVVQDLIRSLKYDGSSHAAHLCADVLADYLREEIASEHAFSPRKTLLVPMPLYPSRKRERGFNQIELVLDCLPQEFKDGTVARTDKSLLIRTRATKQQTRLSRHERLRNVKGAFALTNTTALYDTHVFLIDDVTTTGATLISAGRPLEKAGARVTLIALARA